MWCAVVAQPPCLNSGRPSATHSRDTLDVCPSCLRAARGEQLSPVLESNYILCISKTVLDASVTRTVAFSFSYSLSTRPEPCPKTPRTPNIGPMACASRKEKTHYHLFSHGPRCRARSLPPKHLRHRRPPRSQPSHPLAPLPDRGDTAIAPVPKQKRRHVEVPQRFEDSRFRRRQRPRVERVLRRDMQRHPWHQTRRPRRGPPSRARTAHPRKSTRLPPRVQMGRHRIGPKRPSQGKRSGIARGLTC